MISDSEFPSSVYDQSYSSKDDGVYECKVSSKINIFIFDSLLTAFGLVSGALLVTVICYKSNLRSPKYLLLNNLLVVFLLLLILSGIFNTEEAFDPCWRAGTGLCIAKEIAEPVLTNGVVIFLVAVAIEQFHRYRGLVRPDHLDVRGIQTVSLLWLAVLVFSIPEVINNIAHTHSTKLEMDNCYIPPRTKALYYILIIKQVTLEYFCPVLVLVALLIAISVLSLKSRMAPPPVANNSSGQHPKYFVLVAALTSAYAIGYFPRYSFLLANLIFHIQRVTERKEFWQHLQTIDTIFALIPPAFVPLFVMILSRTHLETVREFFHHIKVRMSRRGWRPGSMEENTGEDLESLDIGMRRVNNHSFQANKNGNHLT
ncbi:hypothetical protein HOLleu_40352 [Holothuria leucospilota]|uniref:G-protein coupled receptors family 1 profile domain-containing protein n=1 Tax=Holothuria leucospilota TaxID=206669 RepID=A0A9Q0YE61_HOLLE|nr:hypothetical protein HOLleu_40352 [Holothuria leucospilota]